MKILVNKWAIKVILNNAHVNCLNLDSRSRLEARDWNKKFPLSSRKTRLKEMNSCSCLETCDWKTKILVLVSRIEIGFLSHPGANDCKFLVKISKKNDGDFMLLMMMKIAAIKVNIAQHVLQTFMMTFMPTSCSFKSNSFFSLLRWQSNICSYMNSVAHTQNIW